MKQILSFEKLIFFKERNPQRIQQHTKNVSFKWEVRAQEVPSNIILLLAVAKKAFSLL